MIRQTRMSFRFPLKKGKRQGKKEIRCMCQTNSFLGFASITFFLLAHIAA
jgi:hypothetical protein